MDLPLNQSREPPAMEPSPSPPLTARPLNVAPALWHKRRSASLHDSIPVPEAELEAQTSEPRVEEEEVVFSVPLSRRPHTSREQLQQHRPSSGSGNGSSLSAARRSGVIGPDPHDCIDLRDDAECSNYVDKNDDNDDEEEPQEKRVVPLPHELYQRPQRRRPAPAVADDLKALVNAVTVDRCRSDSRGQLLLIDVSDVSAEPVPGHPSRPTSGVSVDNAACCAARSASVRAPTEFASEASDDAEAGVNECAGREKGPRASSSSPSTPSPPSAAYADFEFVQDYFYYPATLTTDAAAAAEPPDNEERNRTPARATAGGLRRRSASASSSSSVPRWAHSVAEETPFTPFTFDPQFPGVSAAAMTSASAVPSPAGVAEAPDVAVDRQRVTVLDDVAIGASQRLTVQEVVAAVLVAPPPLPPAVAVRGVALAKDEDDGKGFEDPLDEPAPRKPAEDVCHGLDSPSSSQQEQREHERLAHRVEHVRARLLHVDRLIKRFGAVIAARQTEVAALAEKQQELAQQIESHKTRAAMARKEARRLRDRQHTQEELQLLRDMLVDKENLLNVAQSRLLALTRMRQQLDLLHTASLEKSQLAVDRHERRCIPSASTAEKTTEATGASKRGEAEEMCGGTAVAAADACASESQRALSPMEQQAPRSDASSSSSASSLASLDTCDVMDDFLDELWMEVDALAKVCIQLPSPPPVMSYCSRASRLNGPARRARPTYSALNRHLNDGNNGFFSFFGGATEAHLNSKPLSTFLANVDRLARSSWELEEEVQLRARELATDTEEEELRARLMAEYGLSDKAEAATAAQESLLSEQADSFAATAASSDRTTRQLFLSSPEHGRRSRGRTGNNSSGGELLSPCGGGAVTLPPRRQPTSISLLLPTLVYAYPRIAAVSQHLDDEQQQIQQDYVATIAAARLQRRELVSRLRDAFRLHVAPALQQRIAALQQQQASLARQLGEFGVKEIVLEWEEVEPAVPDEAALWQLMDAATAAGRRRWMGPRRRANTAAVAKRHSRSRSRLSACSMGREEESSGCGDASSSSRGLSLLRGEGESQQQQQVYRRTLHVVCNAAVEDEFDGAVRDATPGSPRSGRRSSLSLSQQQQQQQHTRGINGARSARSARRRPSAGSGRRSSTTTANTNAVPLPQPVTGASLARQHQSVASATALSGSKACAALQLYTNSPSQQLLQLARRASKSRTMRGAEDQRKSEVVEEKGETAAAAGGAMGAALRHQRIAPLATSSQRCSGGTPRVSGAPGCPSSATARSSTASGRASTMVSPSSRHHRRRTVSQPVSPRLSSGRSEGQGVGRHRHTAAATAIKAPPSSRTPAAATVPATAPLVRDTRVRLSTDVSPPYGGPAMTPTAATAAAAAAATTTITGVWSPFEPAHDALADGAVHVVVTFTGAEAHRRQVAQERREAYQREFWQLREELARVDEDIFQLRTRHTDLCEQLQRTVAEQAQKLEEAEAKVKKCRAFYKTLKRENKEWQDICDELQRVIREGA